MGHSNGAGTQLCAASMAGRPIKVEYSTGRDDEGPFVNVLAVHHAGHRIPAHWFAESAIKDFERECEAAEMACDELECEWGIPDERSVRVLLTPRAGLPA